MAKAGGNGGGVGKRGKAKARGWRKHGKGPANASNGRITLKVKKRFERYGDNASPKVGERVTPPAAKPKGGR